MIDTKIYNSYSEFFIRSKSAMVNVLIRIITQIILEETALIMKMRLQGDRLIEVLPQTNFRHS